MSTLVFTAKENGDLKLQAEIEENLADEEAVELLLENAPRLKAEEFVVITGDYSDGVVSTVSQRETVTVKWASSRNGDGEVEEVTKPRSRRKAAEVDDDEDEAPAPRRRGRPPGSKNKPKATTGRGPGRPPGSKNRTKSSPAKTIGKKTGRGGFKRNPASDE